MLYDDKKIAINNYKVVRSKQFMFADREGTYKKWFDLLGDPIATKNAMTYGIVGDDDSKAKRVYQFVVSKFESNGFTKDEAIAYMVKNSKIFSVDVDRISTVLSLSDLVGRGDEMFYEHPEKIYGHLNEENLYIAAKSFSGRECSLEELLLSVDSLPLKDSDEPKALSDKKKVFLATMYLKKLAKEREVRRELK